jgi:hypothetical protein
VHDFLLFVLYIPCSGTMRHINHPQQTMFEVNGNFSSENCALSIATQIGRTIDPTPSQTLPSLPSLHAASLAASDSEVSVIGAHRQHDV